MKKILILGAGEMQVPVIKKAKNKGLYTIVLDMDPHAPGAEYADLFLPVSTNDYDAILLLARDNKIDGILTTSDYPVNIVSRICESLQLPGMSSEVATVCTNKFLQRKFLSHNGIETPFFQLTISAADLNESYDFPVIIKPVDSSASRGVKKVNNIDELKEQYPVTAEFSKKKEVIIEGFIQGREFSVETLTQKRQSTVIAITEKIIENKDSAFFVEDCHIIPARLTPKEYELIEKTVLNLLNKLEINNCPTHTEIKINNTGIYIIEIACRLGGDFIASDLVPLATGVDMLENLIDISLGEPININKVFNKVSSIQFLNSKNYNNGVRFIATGSKHIVKSEVKEFHERTIENSFDRMGYIILQTETVGEMDVLLNQINCFES